MQFDLLLELNETDQGLFGVWEYNTDLFDRGRIVRLSNNFATLLNKIATHPETKLSDLKIILNEVEKKQHFAREEVYQNTIEQKLINVKRRANNR